jgi:arsenite methyltransferase
MTAESVFDATASRKLEAVYLTPDVVEQRHATLRALGLRPGARAGRRLRTRPADRRHGSTVGPSGHVTGLDVSDAMLALSQRRCGHLNGAGRMSFVKADATALPFPDATLDAATSIQVYEYVADLSTALAELHRVLRPGGRALILDTDWDSIVWHTTDTDRMRRLLAAWTQRFADPYLPRSLASQLRAAGFEVNQPQVLVLLNPTTAPTPTASPTARSWPTSPSLVASSPGRRPTPGWLTSTSSDAKDGTSSALTATCSSPPGSH